MIAARNKALAIKRLTAKIQSEMDELSKLILETKKHLARFRDRKPAGLELRGFGDLLHDFYTGLEKIFEAIARELEGGLPSGEKWHQELLEDMAIEIPGIRPAVIAKDTAVTLEEYLRFRHLFRNIYGHKLKWDRLKPLLLPLPDLFQQVAVEVNEFTDYLDRLSENFS